MLGIMCISKKGFEDQLTVDKVYSVWSVGKNSYSIINDKLEQRWYGTQHFRILQVKRYPK